MIPVDICVLLDVSTDDPTWREWSIDQLARWSVRGPLLINQLSYAEWCVDFGNLEAAEIAVPDFGLQWAELPREALYLAAQAHRRYRRPRGARAMLLPDFLMGAHAAVAGIPLLTRDRRRFDTHFDGLELVTPS